MWTSTLELNPSHVIPTKLLGLIWRGAYFSSFAPLQVQNLPRQPLPASNWVRVRNSLAGICGSDLPLIFADGDYSIAPAALPTHNRSYPGHEVVGEVIEVGDDVRHLHVGDRVVLQYGPNCISAGVQEPCRSCASGHYGLCEYGELPGPQPIGGGWSEEMLLHEQQLFRLPSDINDMQGVLLEPSAVAVHAVLRRVPQGQDRVLIIGSGTIGLLILQVVRALAPDAEVSVMARHAFQIEQAARLGAHIIYPKDSYREVQRATGAKLYRGMWGNKMLLGGYDVIYDSVGNTQTTHDALRWARAGSTVVMVGVNLHRMQLDLTPIWYQEINLIGTMGHSIETWPIGSSERRSTFEVTTALIQNKKIFPDKLITHSFPLNSYRDALMTAANKDRNHAIKVVFDYSKQPPSVVPNVRAAARQRQRATTIPVDSRPSQPLVPRREEEAVYREPAVVDMTPYEVMPREVPIQDMPTADIPTAPTRVPVGEDDPGATERVPVITTFDEDDQGDTIVVSVPKYAHSTRGTQSSDPPITGQEEDSAFNSAASPAETEVAQEHLTPQEEDTVFDNVASPAETEVAQEQLVPQEESFAYDNVASPAETEGVQEYLTPQEESFAFDSAASPAEAEAVQEQQAPQEEPLAEMDEPTALAESPVSEMGEIDETWVRSNSLLDTDEESVWLQPLPPSQTVEEPTWLQSITDPHTDEEQPAWLQSLTPSQTLESKQHTLAHESEEYTPTNESGGHTPAHESEEHTLFAASSYTEEENPDVQLTAPASDDGDNESPETVIVTSPKRHRSKRKRNEMKKARLQMVPEEESDQSEPITSENISKGNDEEPA
ncbi:MAG TPA: alcohol dehydrogenase catalytic domain-containing protein [Ktedonobacteraceae bacterium]